MSQAVTERVTTKPAIRRIGRQAGCALLVNSAIALAAIAAVNYGIDSRGYFQSTFAEREKAAYIATLAADLSKPDSRCQTRQDVSRLELIDAYLRHVDPAEIDVVHLGSSFQLVAGQEVAAAGQQFLNACNMGSFLPHWIGIYEFLRTRGVHARRMIIGTDPWAFTQAQPFEHGVRDLQSWIMAGYRRAGIEIDPALRAHFQEAAREAEVGSARHLLDPIYARDNLRLWLNNRLAAPRTADGLTLTSDLSVVRWTDAMVNKKGTRWRNPMAVGLRLAPLDEARFKDLELFLELVAREGAECELVLSPLNPGYHLEPELLALRAEVANRLRSLARVRGIKVRGSYVAADLGLREGDYVDYGHPEREAYRKIFEYVAEPVRSGG